jgi:hypothetical protein
MCIITPLPSKEHIMQRPYTLMALTSGCFPFHSINLLVVLFWLQQTSNSRETTNFISNRLTFLSLISAASAGTFCQGRAQNFECWYSNLVKGVKIFSWQLKLRVEGREAGHELGPIVGLLDQFCEMGCRVAWVAVFFHLVEYTWCIYYIYPVFFQK